MITQKDCIDIFSALMNAPKECSDCVAFCQEGHISCPCNGDWNCEEREFLKEEKEHKNEQTNT